MTTMSIVIMNRPQGWLIITLYNLTISGKSWRNISEPLEGGTDPVLLPVWGFRRGKIHFYQFALESWIYLMVLNRWERKGNPSVTLPLERRCCKQLPIYDIWKLFSLIKPFLCTSVAPSSICCCCWRWGLCWPSSLAEPAALSCLSGVKKQPYTREQKV